MTLTWQLFGSWPAKPKGFFKNSLYFLDTLKKKIHVFTQLAWLFFIPISQCGIKTRKKITNYIFISNARLKEQLSITIIGLLNV